jgi:NIMA (never in mitosis gene a)-related kinase 2
MENYEVLEQLGTGSFGKVCKIRRKSDNKILVWKELNYNMMSEKEKQQIVAEVNILRDLRHPNIVRYYDRIIDKERHLIFIVQEYCEGGDISKLIKKYKKDKQYIPEEMIWKFFMQIILALHEIHSRKEGKILHRDIKPANIFLDANNNVKLGDFGLSKVLSNDKDFAETSVGTPYYMSPEQIIEKKYNEKSDIWALGCLLFELCALSPPFEATNHLSLALKIKSGKFDRIPSVFSNEIMRVVQWMLSRDVKQRPSVAELLYIPEISMRLREKRLKDNRNGLKKKEDELTKKTQELEAMEKALKNRQIELEEREKRLNEEEKRYKEFESRSRTNTSLGYQRDRSLEPDYSKQRTFSYGSLKLMNPLTENNFNSMERKASIDKSFNISIDGFGYEPPKLSKQCSKNEDVTVSEAYLNKLVCQKLEDYGENNELVQRDDDKEADSLIYDYTSQTSAKVL